ncbi:hypothetical protein COLO4_36672 [Corchorus olitorius]|uniref:Uncharacterized protein n=1 Tax=Corchorus olitorius TaxID=93759 RepID=A0A1R3G6R1_9ROSI|nr:hypothetical protein COLO4_36672 [Corchorus olitorius]
MVSISSFRFRLLFCKTMTRMESGRRLGEQDNQREGPQRWIQGEREVSA